MYTVNNVEVLSCQDLIGGKSVYMENDRGKIAIDRVYDAFSRSTDDYVFIGDLRTGTYRFSERMAEEFELPGEIVEDAVEVWMDLVHEQDRAAVRKAHRLLLEGASRSENVEFRARNRRGEWIGLRCRGYVEPDQHDEMTVFAGLITRASQDEGTDRVTGLPSRFEAEKRMGSLTALKEKQPVGLLVLGFDDFRSINDLYDRALGDEVIRMTAMGLKALLPEDAEMFRFDGDEYLILFQNARAEKVLLFYHRVQEFCHSPKEYGGHRCSLTISGGYAEYPKNGEEYQELVKRAVYSLEYSKKSGKDRITFFDGSVMEARERALALTEELRDSIEHGCRGFELHYQPLYSVDEKKITGAEALARFQCEKFGRVSPGEFIPLLEESGLIDQAGKWVFETAVEATRHFVEQIPDFTMHINVSWVQFERGDFLDYLRNRPREKLAEEGHFVLELTESCISSNYEQMRRILQQLHQMGYQVAIDDFGTGYSSLGLLKSIPVNIVKIDQSFIRNLQESAWDMTFIEFIVKLCHTMGMSVCQEGVEDLKQKEELENKELDIYQGFYYGKPMTEESFLDSYAPE